MIAADRKRVLLKATGCFSSDQIDQMVSKAEAEAATEPSQAQLSGFDGEHVVTPAGYQTPPIRRAFLLKCAGLEPTASEPPIAEPKSQPVPAERMREALRSSASFSEAEIGDIIAASYGVASTAQSSGIDDAYLPTPAGAQMSAARRAYLFGMAGEQS